VAAGNEAEYNLCFR